MDTTRVQNRPDDATTAASPMAERSPVLYNTMTQRLEPLAPLAPGRVGVYQCGLTTYDHAHAGDRKSVV